MPRLLSLLTGLTLLMASVGALLLTAACRPPAYRPPAEHEPHAILKVRHVVHRQGGPQYGSHVTLGGHGIDERTIASLEEGSEGSHTFHLRVRPEPAPLVIGGASFHTEQRMVTRYRTVTESYTCYQQQCTGYGTSRSCSQVARTCTRTKQEPYQAWETVRVNDDVCEAGTQFAPRAGATYLVQFDYLGEDECRATCFEQVPQPYGEFEMRPCPVPPPPA